MSRFDLGGLASGGLVPGGQVPGGVGPGWPGIGWSDPDVGAQSDLTGATPVRVPIRWIVLL